MRSLVVYYSYSGNTQKVAVVLAKFLEEKGQVDELELLAEDESKSFLGQCQRAFWQKRAKIGLVDFDLSKYDLICLGTPVWAFGPAPALNTYLDHASGVAGKKIVLFCTYGSGAGKKRCLDYMEKILADKGAVGFRRFYIQQSKIEEKEFVISEIKKVLA